MSSNYNSYGNYGNYGNYGGYGNYDTYTTPKKDNTTMYIIIFVVILVIVIIIIIIVVVRSGNSSSSSTTGTTTNTGTTTTNKVKYYPGLQWVSYPDYHYDNVSTLTTLLSDSNVATWTSKSGIGLANSGIYKGNSYNFSSITTSSTSTNTSGLNAFTDNENVTTQQFYSILWYGYFKPNMTGEWKFTLASDDGSYLWVNSDPTTGIINTSPIVTSIDNFPVTNLTSIGITAGQNSNALINNGNGHSIVTVTGEADFTSGKYYPIIILFGQYTGGASNALTVTSPNGTTYSSNLSGLFFNKISN